MGIYHAFIGIIEAILTIIVIAALEKYRPDLLAWDDKSTSGNVEVN